MNKVQFSTGRSVIGRVNDWILGKSDETPEEILDEVQLLYNDDLLCREDYNYVIDCLSAAVENEE